MVISVSAGGELSLVDLDKLSFTATGLNNPPQPGEGRRRNRHMESITDLAFAGNKVIVAGLSNEEFASKLRVLDFPFTVAPDGTSVEVYHGAHGRFETNSPVRTFVPYEVDGEPHILAAYTCTPLVKFRVADLKTGERITGTTIAELGNRNRPLDMIVYQKDGQKHLLIANDSRGVMKVTTKGIVDAEGITERVGGSGTAGLEYETIEELQGVVQLDKLSDTHAVVLIETEAGELHLKTIILP